jgi:hypothetical protein
MWRLFPHFRLNYICASSWCHSNGDLSDRPCARRTCFTDMYVFRYCTAQTGYKLAISVCLLLLFTYKDHICMEPMYIYIYICTYVTYSHLGVDKTWTLQNILTNGNDLENPIIYTKMTTIYINIYIDKYIYITKKTYVYHTYLPTYLPTYLSIYPSIYLFVVLSICLILPFYLAVYLSICLST